MNRVKTRGILCGVTVSTLAHTALAVRWDPSHGFNISDLHQPHHHGYSDLDLGQVICHVVVELSLVSHLPVHMSLIVSIS